MDGEPREPMERKNDKTKRIKQNSSSCASGSEAAFTETATSTTQNQEEVVMNREQILNVPAGKTLDQIMVDLMGWTQIEKALHYNNSMGVRYTVQDDGVWKFEPGLAHLWQPSVEIHDAWEVLENIRGRGVNVQIDIHKTQTRVSIWSRTMNEFGPEPTNSVADTAPLAICRAAWLCVEES